MVEREVNQKKELPRSLFLLVLQQARLDVYYDGML